MEIRKQAGNTVGNGDIVAGDKTIHNYTRKTKLSTLFEKLKVLFDEQKTITQISDELRKYSDARDVIGLEKKLTDAGKKNTLEHAAWLKELYFKKLTKFQFFEPAQEIHAFLLSLVLSRFNNIIYPLIIDNVPEAEIGKKICDEIIDPIVKVIQEEGCDDIMGLSSTDVEGMIYFLTGQCHIKWVKP